MSRNRAYFVTRLRLSVQVRAHAVQVLGRAGDEELGQYLLQLVQALRYEAAPDSQLSRFLIGRAARNAGIATLLHWYLYIEVKDPAFGSRAAAVHEALLASVPVRRSLR